MFFDNLLWGARNDVCEEPIDQIWNVSVPKRGEQAVEVKGTPEALRQAMLEQRMEARTRNGIPEQLGTIKKRRPTGRLL